MTLRKIVFWAILLAALILAWNHYNGGDPDGGRLSFIRLPGFTSGREAELSESEQLWHDVREAGEQVLSPLTANAGQTGSRLGDLWERAGRAHQQGELAPAEARRMADQLSELIGMQRERESYARRLAEVGERNRRRFDQGVVSDEHRRDYAAERVHQEWSDFVTRSRARLRE